MAAPTIALPRAHQPAGAAEPPQVRRSGWRRPAPILAAYLIIAFVLTSGLWLDPDRRMLANSESDQYFFEWVLTFTPHALAHGANPFFTPLMNAPLGVNLAANTSVVILGLVFAPITLTLGAAVSLTLILTLSLAGTATAWHWLFGRRTRLRPAATAGAAALCGFGPGIMSHANGHLNFTAQFLIPVLLRLAIRLVRPLPAAASTRRRAILRDGGLLALTAVAQYAINPELLLGSALCAVVGTVAWTVQRPRTVVRLLRRIAPRLAVTAGVSVALLAYPLWMQFYGPQSYDGSGFSARKLSENLLAFGAYSNGSLAGRLGAAAKLSLNVVEENTFFGPALLAVAVWAAVRAWRHAHRRAATRSLVITGAVVAILALGPRLRIATWSSHIPLPWALLERLPILGAALPGRLALLLTPILAYLVATLAQDALGGLRALVHGRALARVTVHGRALAAARPPGPGRRRAMAVGLAVAAMLPIVPLPLETMLRPALPRFIMSGEWRGYLPPGTTMIPIPPSDTDSPDGQRWQTATDFAFSIDGGYFLGPGPDGRSFVGAAPTFTSDLFKTVATTGVVPPLPGSVRQQAAADLRYWHAGLIVLPDAPPGDPEKWARYHDALRALAEWLYGSAHHVDDVLIWQVPG